MKVGDLDLGEGLRRLAGPGLAVRMGPVTIRIASTLKEFGRQFLDLYRFHGLVPDDAFIDIDLRMLRGWSLRHPGRRLAILEFGGERPFDPLPLDQAMALFEWGVNWCVAQHAHRFLVIHSGIVARGGHAVLMPGASGAGKSTLTAALCARGWRLFSDELALIEPDSGLVHAMPRPISLKNASIATIRAFSSDVHVGSEIRETRKGTVALIRPPAASVADQDQPARIRHILFPTFRAGQPAAADPMPPGQAFSGIFNSAFNYGMHRQRDFAVLADIVENAAAAEVTYSGLGEATDLVDRLTRLPAWSEAP